MDSKVILQSEKCEFLDQWDLRDASASKNSGLEKIKVESCLDFRTRISRSLFVTAEARLGRFAQLWFYIHMCTMVSHTCVYNGVVAVVCKIHNLQLLANTILVLQQQNGNACANFTMSILLVSVCNSQYSQHTFEEWHVQISQCQARFLSIPLFSSFRRVGTSQL